MLSIFTYTDYRAFLRDAYTQAKQTTPAFSYRYFSRKAGFASPNFLKLVIEGKRNLSADSIPKFSQAFKLPRRERRFFEILVHFNQSGNPEEQAFYYQQLLAFSEYAEAQTLAEEQYEYLSHWYYPAIQELVTLPDFEESPDWIVHTLRAEITPAQARAALECLQRLGLLTRNGDGVLTPAEPHWTTGDSARAAAAYSYHQQMLVQAGQALKIQPAADREFGAITMAVNRAQIKQLKNAIRDFRRSVMNLVGRPTDPATAVYQLSIQLFGHTDLSGEPS